MLPKNDQLWLGLVLGLILPVMGYFLAIQSNEWIASALNKPFAFKESTVFLIAICANMLPIGYFRRRFYTKALRGVMVVTMLLALGWFIKFGSGLF